MPQPNLYARHYVRPRHKKSRDLLLTYLDIVQPKEQTILDKAITFLFNLKNTKQ